MPRDRLQPKRQFPVDPIVDNTISIFLRSIDCYNSNPSAAEDCSLLRYALMRYSAVDKRCHAFVKQTVCLKFYLLFYDCLTERPLVERRFLDGVFDVNLFDGSYGAGPNEIKRFQALSPLDLIKDRIQSAKKLATFDDVQIKTRSGHYLPDDLPDGVGMRVAAFVGRCRLLTQCVSKSSGVKCVTLCDACTCKRKMLDMGAGRVHELFGTRYVRSSKDDDDDDDDYVAKHDSWSYPATSYWARIVPGVMTNLPRLQFCSLRCVRDYEHELSMVMPINTKGLESHECQSSVKSKVGLSRVVAVSRISIKRNAAAVRALRQSRHAVRRMRSTTLGSNVVEAIHRNVEDMLNIDLGLLQAAASIAESPVAANGRLLPGTQTDWRADPQKWSRAIEIAKSIYVANKGTDSRSKVVDEREFPSWLRKVRDAALTMYPTTRTGDASM